MKNKKKLFMFIAVLIIGVFTAFQHTLIVNAEKYTVKFFRIYDCYYSGDEIDVETLNFRYNYEEKTGLSYAHANFWINNKPYKTIDLDENNHTIVLPTINGRTVEWMVDGERSYQRAPWSQDDTYVQFEGHIDADTELKVICDKDKLVENETTKCAVYAYRNENDFVHNIYVNLKSDNLIFDNIRTLSYLTITKMKDNRYNVQPGPNKGNVETDYENQVSMDYMNYYFLMSFEASAKEINSAEIKISTEGSSFLTSTGPEGELVEQQFVDVPAVLTTDYVEPEKTPEVKGEEEVVETTENPKTGIFNTLLLIIPILLFGLGYYLVMKKNIFKFNK